LPEPVFITLGSNIDPHQNLRRAVQMIGQKFPIQAASRVYETAPIDAAGNVDGSQAAFLNAAVLITTEWEEFESLNYTGKTVVDGRRIERARDGSTYDGVCW